MKSLSRLLVLTLFFGLFSANTTLAETGRYFLKCRESYLKDFLPVVSEMSKEIPIRVITHDDVGNGTHIGADVGTLGGALDEKFSDFKISARVTRLIPWMILALPDGTQIFNGESAPEYSRLGVFPKLGKTAHKVTCEIEKVI